MRCGTLQDAVTEVCAELSGQPDLIIGNYSDGNLVASLLSHHLNVTQVYFLHLINHAPVTLTRDHQLV